GEPAQALQSATHADVDNQQQHEAAQPQASAPYGEATPSLTAAVFDTPAGRSFPVPNQVTLPEAILSRLPREPGNHSVRNRVHWDGSGERSKRCGPATKR